MHHGADIARLTSDIVLLEDDIERVADALMVANEVMRIILTTAINLKRLAAAIAALLWLLLAILLDLAACAPRTTRGRMASALARRAFFNSPTIQT